MRWLLLFVFVLMVGCSSGRIAKPTIEIGIVDSGHRQTSIQEVEAFEKYCNELVGPAWNTPHVDIILGYSETGYNLLTIDEIFDPAACGWHYSVQGNVLGIVQVVICEQHQINPTVVISHELMEMLVNPFETNLTIVGDRAYPTEPADPVEGHSFSVDGVLMSNFVFPRWFDPKELLKPGHTFDYMGILTEPLQIRGGHMVYFKNGNVFVDR